MKTLADIGELHPLNSILSKEERINLLTNSLSNANLTDERKNEIKKILSDAFDVKLYPDSEETILSLKPKYKLAIVSNMYPITSNLVRENFSGFLDNFDVVSLSTEVGLCKPDSNFFSHTLKSLNDSLSGDIKPSEVLFIGDNEDKDIKPALSLGMQARLIDRNKEELKDVLANLI